MAKNVLVLADIRRQKVRNVTFEMLAAAHHMADGGQVSARPTQEWDPNSW
jgi:electron transfer flavoprotein alpha subunit